MSSEAAPPPTAAPSGPTTGKKTQGSKFRGPRPTPSGNLSNDVATFANLIKSQFGDIRLVARAIPITTRGLGLLCRQVASTINASFRAQQQQQVDPVLLYRIMLVLVEAKIEQAIRHGANQPINEYGSQPVVTDLNRSWFELQAMVKILPAPLALYLNAIGNLKLDEFEYVPSRADAFDATDGDCLSLFVFANNIRNLPARYAGLAAAQRTVFRSRCTIPGIVYADPPTTIDNIDAIFPENCIPFADWNALRLTFEVIVPKAPGFFGSVKPTFEGTSLQIPGTRHSEVELATRLPGRVVATPFVKLPSTDILPAVILLLGEYPAEAIMTLAQVEQFAIRSQAISVQRVEANWLNIFTMIMQRRN